MVHPSILQQNTAWNNVQIKQEKQERRDKKQKGKNDAQFYSIIKPVGHVTAPRHVTYQLAKNASDGRGPYGTSIPSWFSSHTTHMQRKSYSDFRYTMELMYRQAKLDACNLVLTWVETPAPCL